MKVDGRTATLAGVLVLVLTAIVWLIVAENEAIQLQLPPSLPEPTTAEGIKVTDWISALGTATGALVTAGALLLGAITYSRQIRDQHRAQAAAVTVHIAKNGLIDNKSLVALTNGSNLPVYNVELVSLDPEYGEFDKVVTHVVVDQYSTWLDDDEPLHMAYARFTDAAGVRWRRDSKGSLTDLGNEPAGFTLLATATPAYEERAALGPQSGNLPDN